MESKHKVTPGEAIVWNMVLPGVSQLLNGYYSTAILLLILDFLIYMKSHFNDIIVWSLTGEISKAIENRNTCFAGYPFTHVFTSLLCMMPI